MCFPLSASAQEPGKQFSLDDGTVNGEHRIAELVTEKNMITNPCEVNRIACAIGDTDMDGCTKEGYGNWFRYYNVPTEENYKAILRVDDESEEEYLTVYDNENHEQMVLVAKEYGDGADFETTYSIFINDTIYSCTINGHYQIDEDSDTFTKPLRATSDTIFRKRYFRTSKHKSTIGNIADIPAQNILNQYDSEGRKNGQWIEVHSSNSIFVTNYKHGKEDGICYQLKHNGVVSSIYEFNNGNILKMIYFNDQGRLSFMLTDFIDIDTIVHGKELTHRFKKRFKSICYHPNGVIESITNDYLKEGGSPEMDSFEIGKAYYYDDKGNLIKTEERFFPSF
jgi:hypothetical protein